MFKEIRKTITVPQEDFMKMLSQNLGINLEDFKITHMQDVYPSSLGLVQIELTEKKFNDEVEKACLESRSNTINAIGR